MVFVPTIKPQGVADLFVMKQRLARYEAGEVAHIENVMGREFKGREHRRFRQTVQLLEAEQELLEENIRDLQSTERFELENEIERTIRSETTFQAGAEISGGFGPVSISAYARFSTSDSAEESRRTASRYAKEVTERALSRVVQKTREKRVSSTTEETEEKNKHEFDNREDPGHVVGQYRWVDKYYRHKVVNYGARLFYEFIVPEPAALYRYSQEQHVEADLPPEPEVPRDPDSGFELRPDHISGDTYLSLIAQYDVQDAEPPPPESVIITKEYSGKFDLDDGYFEFLIDDMEIPKGYVANSCWFVRNGYSSSWPTADAQIIIGTNYQALRSADHIISLNNETDKIPIVCTGKGWEVFTLIFTLEVECQLSDQLYAAWQLDTFTKIMNAYNKQRLNFEDARSASQIQEGVRVSGRNPAINREIEREQLQRLCLGMWADLWSLPSGIGTGLPFRTKPWAVANGEKIRFFEGAFDWRNMTYEFLPVQYARESQWTKLLGSEDNDPLFEKFLRAGAAKVRVPVTPTHAEAVLWYQLTGEIRTVGTVPAMISIGDPEIELYNGYLFELDAAEELPDLTEDVEIDAEDPETWLVKVPTTLVWLQQDEHQLPDLEATA